MVEARVSRGPAWTVDVAKLERSRILRGWTQRRLALQAHVDRGTLNNLVLGRRRPTLGTIQAVCRVLNLTLADVIVFVDTPMEYVVHRSEDGLVGSRRIR